jgi:hypothetical protein
MWALNRLLGFGLMFGGISVLAKSIFITTGGFMISAPTVIICTIGILIIVYGVAISNWGWGVIGVGIVVTLSKAGIWYITSDLGILYIIQKFYFCLNIFTRKYFQ